MPKAKTVIMGLVGAAAVFGIFVLNRGAAPTIIRTQTSGPDPLDVEDVTFKAVAAQTDEIVADLDKRLNKTNKLLSKAKAAVRPPKRDNNDSAGFDRGRD